MKNLSDAAKMQMLTRITGIKDQFEKSMKAILEGKPLLAEGVEERKIGRIQSLLPDLDIQLIKRLVNYDKPALDLVPPEKRSLVKSLWGLDEDKDYVGVAYLEIAQAAASSVGRIVKRSDLSPIGTGFMISDTLLMTNWHVIDEPLTAQNHLVEFNYELNAFGYPKPVKRFEFDPETFFFGNEADEPHFEGELDFAIVAVRADRRALANFGFCPLSNAGNKHALGDFATVVQHPEGGLKQVALRENRIVARLDDPPVIHYVSDTAPGSSGSPVFDDQWRVIGLHHGYCSSVEVYPGGVPVPSCIKEAARASGIVNYVERYLASHPEKFSATQRALIKKALRCPFSGPSRIERARQKFLV